MGFILLFPLLSAYFSDYMHAFNLISTLRWDQKRSSAEQNSTRVPKGKQLEALTADIFLKNQLKVVYNEY